MCGIAGFIGFENKNIPEAKIGKAMHHRGPDFFGTHKPAENVLLCHARLSIIDLSSDGHQPFISEDGRFSMIFNGEIFNFQEIRQELITLGHAFKTKSDTEVLLKSFLQWGQPCIEKFRGMFAFAIYDKIKGELFGARDRLGIKPFYYVLNEEGFGFASEVRTLLASGIIAPKLNKEMLPVFLSVQNVPFENTLIEGIKSLLPGELFTYKKGEGISIKPYWQPETFLKEESEQLGMENKTSEIKEEIFRAIEMRLISDVPIGAFLSGGMDSSLLCSIIRQIFDLPLDTFTVGFEHPDFDDMKYAGIAAKYLGTKHHVINLPLNEIPDKIPMAMRSADHPSADGINTWIVSDVVAKTGLKVALSGMGGDELFGGYPSFERMAKFKKVKPLLSLASPFINASKPFLKSFEQKRFAEMATKQDLYSFYSINREFIPEERLKKFFETPYKYRDVYSEYMAQRIGDKKLTAFDVCSYGEITCYMANVLLSDVDQMSMAHTLEVRVPFIDHKVVEKVLATPTAYKFAGLANKHLSRMLFRDMLPEAIWNRPKQGFAMPWDEWLRGPLKSFVQERMAFGKKTGLFSEKALDDLQEDFYGKRVNWARIWVFVNLFYWIENNAIEC